MTLMKLMLALYAQGGYVQIVDDKKMKINDYYDYVDAFIHHHDRFFAVLDAGGMGRKKQSVIVLNKHGEVVQEFEERGYGPGEIRSVVNISVVGDLLYFSEQESNLVHVKDLHLKHIRDFHVERGGFIAINNERLLGIWSARITARRTYMLTLYDPRSLKALKKAMPLDPADAPPFVGHHGGIARFGEGYIGVFSNDYRPIILDESFNVKKRFLKRAPRHVVAYKPWKKDRQNIVYKEFQDWFESWFLMINVFSTEGKVLIFYSYSGQFFVDVFDKSANLLDAKVNVGGMLYEDGDGVIWRVRKEEHDDNDFYFGRLIIAKD